MKAIARIVAPHWRPRNDRRIATNDEHLEPSNPSSKAKALKTFEPQSTKQQLNPTACRTRSHPRKT